MNKPAEILEIHIDGKVIVALKIKIGDFDLIVNDVEFNSDEQMIINVTTDIRTLESKETNYKDPIIVDLLYGVIGND